MTDVPDKCPYEVVEAYGGTSRRYSLELLRPKGFVRQGQARARFQHASNLMMSKNVAFKRLLLTSRKYVDIQTEATAYKKFVALSNVATEATGIQSTVQARHHSTLADDGDDVEVVAPARAKAKARQRPKLGPRFLLPPKPQQLLVLFSRLRQPLLLRLRLPVSEAPRLAKVCGGPRA